MGEIIIRVPEDIKEVINLKLPYNKVKETLENLEKKEKAKLALEIVRKYKGTVKIENVSEEEIYMQGD